jgi:hypothetical protein
MRWGPLGNWCAGDLWEIDAQWSGALGTKQTNKQTKQTDKTNKQTNEQTEQGSGALGTKQTNHDHAAAGPRSLTNRIDGFYDRRLQRSNLEKPVRKSIDSDRRTSRTSRGMDMGREHFVLGQPNYTNKQTNKTNKLNKQTKQNKQTNKQNKQTKQTNKQTN